MKVEVERIRSFDPLQQPSVPIGKDRSSADGGVDVKPKLLLKGKIREALAVVLHTATPLPSSPLPASARLPSPS
jgi:hypothetical protein